MKAMDENLIWKLLTLLVCFIQHCGSDDAANSVSWDYCVIGAGPGGLQIGYFLDRAARNYVIFEKGNSSGTFFQYYPRHRKLISINKRHTGKTNKEFNLRHDWNSLLSDDESLQMRHYSRVFFPHADDYVRYLNDYTQKLGLNVQYKIEISNIRRHGPSINQTDYFTMNNQDGVSYTCTYVIISTGVAIPSVPNFPGVELSEGYENLSMDQDDFEGQSVLILGRGNSAFETADHIMGNTNVIHMIARSRVRLAWATHYVGDLRAINNGILDTYQLKSLDGIVEGDVQELILIKSSDGKILLDVDNSTKFRAPPSHQTNSSNQEVDYIIPDNFPLRDSYDRVIRCLGFKFDFSIFENDTSPMESHYGKYPTIKADYEAEGIPGMYFAGTNTHSLDFRKSAGGFIHGYRYTARALHHTLEYRNHQVPWPSVIQPITGLLDHIIKRMNEASGLYQMFQVLADVVILHRNGMDYEYLEEFPIKMVHKLPEMSGKSGSQYIIISLEYGKHFSGAGQDTFRSERATGEPQEAHTSNFLHPVFYYYKTLPTEEQMMNIPTDDILPVPDMLHHIVEDFLTDWTAPISHILVLRRFLETVLHKDIRHFWDHQCFELALTYDVLPISCQSYVDGHGLLGNEELWLLSESVSV